MLLFGSIQAFIYTARLFQRTYVRAWYMHLSGPFDVYETRDLCHVLTLPAPRVEITLD